MGVGGGFGPRHFSMRILQRRQYPIRNIEPNSFHEKLLDEAACKRCAVCRCEWPASMVTPNADGQERCPDCFEITTATWKAETQAEEAAYAASRTLRPQISQVSLNETRPGVITSITDSAGNKLYASHPVSVSKGGAAVTVKLNGQRFLSTDTIAYSSGISNNSAPVLTGTTLWTLSVVASGGMTAGDYNLTFNSQVYRGIFRVR